VGVFFAVCKSTNNLFKERNINRIIKRAKFVYKIEKQSINHALLYKVVSLHILAFMPKIAILFNFQYSQDIFMLDLFLHVCQSIHEYILFFLVNIWLNYLYYNFESFVRVLRVFYFA